MSNNINTFSDEQLQTINNIVQNAVATITKGRLLTFKQGAKADLPNLKVGEPAFCTDEFTFWIGSDDGNKPIGEKTNVIDNLTSTSSTDALSANQGKELKALIDGIGTGGTGGGGTVSVVDNLTSTSTSSALSAYQGKILKDLIDNANQSGGGLTNVYQNNVSADIYGTAFGFRTVASGDYSHAQNDGTIANVLASTAIGSYNKVLSGISNDVYPDVQQDLFVIGNGYSENYRSNAFRVSFDGATYGQSAFNSTGADYAEFFEWEDKNKDNDDRVGYVVTLSGDKIRFANSKDLYILGIVSANPSVIGDSYQDDWNGRYVLDKFGRIINETKQVEIMDTDENGKEIRTGEFETVTLPLHNPQWNNEIEYTPREKRPEWSPVGLVGKLLVRDDGTSEVNGYAKVGEIDGELTKSDSPTQFRVMERVSDNIIRVFIK